jgi:hypothetical protein
MAKLGMGSIPSKTSADEKMAAAVAAPAPAVGAQTYEAVTGSKPPILRELDVPFGFRVPTSVKRAFEIRAKELGLTNRDYLLQILAREGFTIPQASLGDLRKFSRGR